MKNGKKSILLLFLAFLTHILLATEPVKDTVILLGEIQVSSNRHTTYAVGNRIQNIDTNILHYYQSASIAELLRASTAINIKTYGYGGLASLSVRGGGSAQTAVIWNGLNMEDPMGSSMNLSLLPTSFFNSVKFQYGGSSTLFGSGSMTGIIHLSSDDFNKSANNVNIEYTAGSLGLGKSGISSKVGNENYAFGVKAFRCSSDNKYRYYNRLNKEYDTIKHGSQEQAGIMLDGFLRTSENSQLKSSVYYYKNDKDLQETMIQSLSFSNQKDEGLNASINYKYFGKNHLAVVKGGIFYHKLDYIDNAPGKMEISENHSTRYILEADDNFTLNKFLVVNAGINYTLEQGFSTGYTDTPDRNRFSLFSSLKANNLLGKINLVASSRIETVSGAKAVPVLSLSSNIKILKHLTLRGTVSSNYRLPSFNDLFWAETGFAKGNPDLKPEKGKNIESGIDVDYNYTFLYLSLRLSGFYNTLENKIVWRPNNEGKWEPNNYKSGSAFGGEGEGSIEVRTSSFYSGLKANYNYTESYELEQNDKQQFSWYVPPVTTNIQWSAGNKTANAFLAFSYISNRLYDNTNELKPYNLWDAGFSVNLKTNLFYGNVNFKMNNLFNTQYEVTAWYPMPGRYLSFGIQMGLHNF